MVLEIARACLCSTEDHIWDLVLIPVYWLLVTQSNLGPLTWVYVLSCIISSLPFTFSFLKIFHFLYSPKVLGSIPSFGAEPVME